MTQRLIFQHKYKSFGCANDVNLSFSDRLLMCKNNILIYYQHMGQFFLVGATKVCACDKSEIPKAAVSVEIQILEDRAAHELEGEEAQGS